MGKPVNITLSVRASALYNANPQPADQTALDTYCSLEDNNNGAIPPGKTLNDFTSQVYKDQLVTWLINNSGTDNYQVKILSVVNSSDPPFFNPSTISAPQGGAASVNGTCNVNSGSDTYTINFKVTLPGSKGGTKNYSLDPKLGGNP
ncbi:MAG: hypothetical protein HKO75_01930 [Flavobacteriaceae bacterium]|nr:hypothetical protein [Muriicola sp.]NNK21661.1 hypothetical protein [Flavobacteriaceae bacterium]NNL38596.1 hypothetical protein [Flavobacteriaceae bacterium]